MISMGRDVAQMTYYKFKKIVSEMRFDETTARYGEFGSFFVGHIINTNEFDQFFAIS